MFRFPVLASSLWAIHLTIHAAAIPPPRSERSIRKPKVPPAWDLAPKVEFDAAALLRDENDQMGRFMLGLATAYNDLKGLVLFEQYLLSFERPRDEEFTPSAGQWRGLHIQILRMMAGVLNELQVLVADNLGLANREVRALVPPSRVAQWNRLINAAKRKGPDGRADGELLWNVRRKCSFHYDLTDLTEGYLNAFVRSAADQPYNRSAQCSFGPDMDGTRFFYADAAAQHVLGKYGREVGTDKPLEALVHLARDVNAVLGPTLVAFIRSRTMQADARQAAAAGL